MHNVYMKLRIRALREARGISQEAAAEQLGISGATLSRIENNAQNTKLDTIKALSELYRVSVPELFEYDGANPLIRLAWDIPEEQAALAADLLEAFERHANRAPLRA